MLEVAAEHSDAHVAPALLSFQPVESAIRAALSDPNEANRGRGLSLLGTLLRTAPAELCARLCQFSRRLFSLRSQLFKRSLSRHSAIAFALAHVPAAGEAEGDADATTGGDCDRGAERVCCAAQPLLYAPIIQLQHIAALSLSKLILGAVDALDGEPSSSRSSPRAPGGLHPAHGSCETRG